MLQDKKSHIVSQRLILPDIAGLRGLRGKHEINETRMNGPMRKLAAGLGRSSL